MPMSSSVHRYRNGRIACAADISYRFGRQCRTLHDVSQQRAMVLSLLASASIAIAVKLNLLVPFDQAAEAWTQRHITRLHTT
jgi:hypothetical protein